MKAKASSHIVNISIVLQIAQDFNSFWLISFSWYFSAELATWRINQSVMLEDYIDLSDPHSFLIEPTRSLNDIDELSPFCGPRVKMLILVASAPPNFVARNAIRESWGARKTLAIKGGRILFFLGRSDNSTLDVSKAINALPLIPLTNERTFLLLTEFSGWGSSKIRGHSGRRLSRYVSQFDTKIPLNAEMGESDLHKKQRYRVSATRPENGWWHIH